MRKSLLGLLCALPLALLAQKPVYTLDDTLRGQITPERAWWDLSYYDLALEIDPTKQAIKGQNTIYYRVLKPESRLQIDLQPPLTVSKIIQNGVELSWTKRGQNAYIAALTAVQPVGTTQSVTVYYEGQPRRAKNAPWDGGFSWSKDRSGQPFVATSCQGLGASVWWPCKDHMYDEPDSMAIAVTVPPGLMDVSNGRLRRVDSLADGRRTFHWAVRNPINNYGVNVNMANYAHFSDTYEGEKGLLDLNYYVLPENLNKAKVHFQQTKLMLKAFEHWFGPYPFYEDGFKLVEVPYLGMEHQSSVTYGNGYRNGYRGTDLSGTGWGLKWDFIIVHESGHEWFANNITYKDAADMWVHESFTNYSEGLFVEYHYGKEAGAAYIRGCRRAIENKSPIVGVYGLNKEGSGDMYYKGGNMLHTIRQIINDDAKWRAILRGMNKKYYHQTVDGAEIEAYMSRESGRDLSKVFDQYLRDIRIPHLVMAYMDSKWQYRWENCVGGFNMPVQVSIGGGAMQWLYPTTTWQSLKLKKRTVPTFVASPDFYIQTIVKK